MYHWLFATALVAAPTLYGACTPADTPEAKGRAYVANAPGPGTTLPGSDAECSDDGDCVVLSNCCRCAAIPKSATPRICDVATCAEDRCRAQFASTGSAPVAVCDEHRCKVMGGPR